MHFRDEEDWMEYSLVSCDEGLFTQRVTMKNNFQKLQFLTFKFIFKTLILFNLFKHLTQLVHCPSSYSFKSDHMKVFSSESFRLQWHFLEFSQQFSYKFSDNPPKTQSIAQQDS